MRVDGPTDEVEDGAAEDPIRSPIGSLRRAEATACVLARAGGISITLSGVLVVGGIGAGRLDDDRLDDDRLGPRGVEDSAVGETRRLPDVCGEAVGLAKNGAG